MIHQFKKLDEKKLEEILLTYKAGHSISAVARLFDVSRATVRHHLQKMKVRIRSAEDYLIKPKKVRKK